METTTQPKTAYEAGMPLRGTIAYRVYAKDGSELRELGAAEAMEAAHRLNSFDEVLHELRILSDWVDSNVTDPACINLINSARAAILKATKA